MHIYTHPVEIDWPTGCSAYVYIGGATGGAHVVWGQPWVRLPDGRVFMIRWNE